MQFTARDIITQAQKDCGILGLGQTMNAEDTNDAFIRLSNMIAQWQVRRWLKPSLYDIAMPGNNEKSNRIGPGQYWNTNRPDKIFAAYFLQLNSGSSNPVSFPLWPVFSYEDYSRISLKQLNSWPTRYFYDNQFPYGNVYIWPIPTSAFEIHLILGSQLGFSTSISSGTITNAGAGYIGGAFVAIPLINLDSAQVGISATANVTVNAGTVIAFEIQNGGQFYKIGDRLTLDPTSGVGAGTGFIYTVTDLTSNLDSIMEFPEYYMDALIYNLSIRLSAMYQLPATDDTKKLANTSLKAIVGANTQVPTLSMPRTLLAGRRRSGIVNANGGVVWADIP